MHKQYGKQVQFLGVYVREAHPTDGWREVANDRLGISVAQPRTRDERHAVASRCNAVLAMDFPLLVDELGDAVGHAYSGMPDRLYLIDSQGRVAYKSGRGPFGFKPQELEQALLLLLIEEGAEATQSRSATSGETGQSVGSD